MSPVEVYRRRRPWYLPRWQAVVLHPHEGTWIPTRHAWTSIGAARRGHRTYESLHAAVQ